MTYLEKLKAKYLRKTKENQSNVYAQMGALGISPEHLKVYEESVNLIKDHKEEDVMEFNLNVESKLKHRESGDIMTLESFIESCRHGEFIDYDGFANEIILNGNIVWKEKWIYPSQALANQSQLLQLDKEHGGLEIVWYNK